MNQDIVILIAEAMTVYMLVLCAHSDAEFTHSICPECARRLYPDLDFD